MTDLAPLSSPPSPLILIADDDSSIRALLRLALEEEGYRVEEAINGEDCLEKYARLQPDLVLLDAIMPEMDGLTCCQHLRSSIGDQWVPLLMITFLDDRDSIDRAFTAGATDYITKPIHWSVLRQRVKRLLASARVLRTVASLRARSSQQQAWEAFLREILRQFSTYPLDRSLLEPILAEACIFFEVEHISLSLPPLTLGYALEEDLVGTELEARYREGEIIAIGDLRQTSLASSVPLQKLGTQSLLIVPIHRRQQLHGVLGLHRARVGSWNEETVARVSDFARAIALGS